MSIGIMRKYTRLGVLHTSASRSGIRNLLKDLAPTYPCMMYDEAIDILNSL
jgi:hypothetical protein